jgi:hypothetical protein
MARYAARSRLEANIDLRQAHALTSLIAQDNTLGPHVVVSDAILDQLAFP